MTTDPAPITAAQVREIKAKVDELLDAVGDITHNAHVRKTGMTMHLRWSHPVDDVMETGMHLRNLFVAAPDKFAVALGELAEVLDLAEGAGLR